MHCTGLFIKTSSVTAEARDGQIGVSVLLLCTYKCFVISIHNGNCFCKQLELCYFECSQQLEVNNTHVV